MSLSVETKRLMEDFYTYVQTGNEVNLPNVDANRLRHYRRLVRNVFDDTLRRAYPITVEDLTQDEWAFMVDAFMGEAAPQTPYIWKMPFEFYEFALNADFAGRFNKPYLDDLLYFEWIEIELFTMPDKVAPRVRFDGDFMQDRIVANPESKVIELEYPIHRVGTASAVLQKGRHFVLAFRVQDSGQVRFVEIDALLALLWQRLREKPVSGRELFTNTAKMIAFPQAQIETAALPFFNDMLLQGALLGFSV